MMIKHHMWFLALLALVSLSLGCAAMVRSATPAMVSGAMKGLSDPHAQDQLVASIDEGRVKIMSARLSAGIIDGVLDTMEDPARQKRLVVALNGITMTATDAAMDSILNRVFDEKVQGKMRLALDATVTELMTKIFENMDAKKGRSAEGATAFGAGAHEIARQATLGIFETVDAKMGSSEERSSIFGTAIHEIAKEATLGFQDALDATRRDRESGAMLKENGALMIAAGNASLTGNRILLTLGIGLGAVVLGLVIMLTWAIIKNRKRQAELDKRDDALALLTEAIKSTATVPGADEFHKVLKSSIRDRAGAEHLRKVLGEQARLLLEKDKQE